MKVIGLALTGLGYIIVSAGRHLAVKKRAFNYARSLFSSKGIINLGAGPHRTLLAREIAESPEVVVNIDLVPDGLPQFTQLDIEVDALPFSDKQFDCSFMSHVLEHLYDWEFALNEAIRVADYVVVVLPHPVSIAGLLNPDHRQHFNVRDMKDIEHMYPSVKIFC